MDSMRYRVSKFQVYLLTSVVSTITTVTELYIQYVIGCRGLCNRNVVC